MLKPKLKSLQRRFVLLQAGTLMIAIWFVAGAGYLSYRIRADMSGPLEDLSRALELSREVESAAQNLLTAAHRLGANGGLDTPAEVNGAITELNRLIPRYNEMNLSAEERGWVDVLGGLPARLQETAQQIRPDSSAGAREQVVLQLETLTAQVNYLLHLVSESQVRNTRNVFARLQLYTGLLYSLLGAFGVFAIVIVRLFRRMHRRQLWEPMEELHGMIEQVRGGKFDVRARIPENIEMQPVFRAFLDMATELAEMRRSLEKKVVERTSKLEETQRQLLQSAKLSALGQLVSGVAHEVNNPLTAILGFSEVILTRPNLEDKLRAQVETIREEALRLKHVVANLTSFSRRSAASSARIDLRHVLDRLVDMRAYQLSVSNVRLHYAPPSAPVWVQGDPEQFLQVFFSLVLNAEQAIKAGRTDGDIWIVCEARDAQARVSIRDNGAGIAPYVKERIFEPFFTTKPMGQGTGMGLAVSREIVQHHRGEITVESVEGQGSTFHVVLPVSGEAEPGAEKKPPRMVASNNAGRKALVIDDEPGVTDVVEQAMSRHGLSSTVLRDPMALESAIARHDFDLVICDMKMPGRSGLDVLRLLREKRPELAGRFLLMTGDTDDTERSAVELRGIQILRKPFSLVHLMEVVGSVLEKAS